MKESRSNSSRRRISGQSLIKYKSLELVMCFQCLRNNKKTKGGGIKEVWKRRTGNEVRKVTYNL